MHKKFHISNEGIIFGIKDDGAIIKLAKIDDQGQICTLSGDVMTANAGSKGGYWLFIVLFAIATIIFGVLYAAADNKYSRANRERNEYREKYETASSTTSSLRSEISRLKQEHENAKSELSNLKSTISNTYPLIISDIEIANKYKGGTIETDFGRTIYSSRSMYLTPKIKYYGLSSGVKRLKVKLYRPDGSLSTGSYSTTYSYSDDIYLYDGENSSTLSGWGNENTGHWRSGTYRIEIWYENSCLKSKTFTIY